MELQITGTNMQIPPEVHLYIEEKFNKLTKHLPDIIDIKVEISEEGTKSRQQRYLVRATVNSGVGGPIFHGEERAEDLLIATDKATKALTRQLEKRKGKLYDRGKGNKLVRGKYQQTEPAANIKKIVKTKRFSVDTMTQEEAIEQMEHLGHDFFLFVESKSDEVELLYRRKDGNYGIIQPGFRKIN